MDSLLSRYRDLSVLLLVIMAQLLLLAYQVRSNQDVRLIRVWAVTAVTPVARAVEGVRSGVAGFFGNYIMLRDIRDQNRTMEQELGRLKMENQYLKTELATADRARALAAFQSHTQSRTLAARVIGTGAGTGSKLVFVDRGSVAGVEKGMAVVTPDGIVGKVIGSFPTASQVLLVTDSSFAAGVISQKNRVRGTLKGQGYSSCRVDYVQNEEKVEPGEWFYTTGDDRVFPKGMPVGQVKVVRPGSPFKEVVLDPSGFQNGLEEVLIVLEGVHQQIPDLATASPAIHLTSPPPDGPEHTTTGMPSGPGTEADRLREKYKAIGEAQGHKFGEGTPGSKPPDFNAPVAAKPAAPAPRVIAPNAPPAAAAKPPATPPASPRPAPVRQ
jgi:rod shape-determining protein MreC